MYQEIFQRLNIKLSVNYEFGFIATFPYSILDNACFALVASEFFSFSSCAHRLHAMRACVFFLVFFHSPYILPH